MRIKMKINDSRIITDALCYAFTESKLKINKLENNWCLVGLIKAIKYELECSVT